MIMQQFKLLHISIASVMFAGMTACQTTDKVARVDAYKKRIQIQSQADRRSAVNYLLKDGALDQAYLELLKSLKKQPKKIGTLLNLSQINIAKGNLKKAEAYCRKALKHDLKNQDARLILANIYYRRDNFEMADIILNGLSESSQNASPVLNLKAMIAMKKDRPALALATFKRALKVDPGSIATRMNLGVLYLYHEQVDNAAIEFERVLKLMPGHPDAKLHLGIVHSIRKNYGKAEDLFNEIVEIDQANPLALYNLAILEERQENFDESLVYLRRYLDTRFAQSKNNEEVFALIDRIRAKKEALGDAMTDEQIEELASRTKSAPQRSLGKNTPMKEDVSPDTEESYEDGMPSSVPDDVDELERMLK